MTRRSLSDRIGAAMMRRTLTGFEPGDRHVEITRVETPMSDGTVLLGDLLMPDRVEPGTPTVVMRTPYGRSASFRVRLPLPLASRGYPVLLQSVRGTFGSGGEFTPQVHEASDGLDTLRWVRRQPWFTGHLVSAGSSYLGFTQWSATAAANRAGEPETAAESMSLAVTMPDFGAITWDHGAFALLNSLTWSRMMTLIESPKFILTMIGPDRRFKAALGHTPLGGSDRAATGAAIPWWDDWLRNEDLREPYWAQQSYRADVADVTATISMTTGWYDIFLPWQIGTYEDLVAQGRQPQLTIGPWGHDTAEGSVAQLEGAMAMWDEQFRGIPNPRPAPVRFFLGGAGEWHDDAAWPPVGTRPAEWFLGAGGTVGPDAPTAPGDPTRFRYDPSGDPTPSTGGPVLRGDGGAVDDREHEQRSDVVTFTSAPLTADLDVTGTPVAKIWLRSDRSSVDVFVRLTEVHPDGRSMSVTDAIRRVGAPGTLHSDPPRTTDGAWEVEVPLWPTAHRFAAGNRLRVQVSSGAFPRYARNGGTGEPAATETELLPANQDVFHEPARPSSVTLPVWSRA
ncbi:CocE/NonD family hydrolase [Agromyces sp. Marseille-Q5079]|uniref:CocE/NonD family hydrolase n=1 Tax=Agromyces sp. Marseille-Q5079 TaxID=3439059 RepID=UPI003D9C9B5A